MCFLTPWSWPKVPGGVPVNRREACANHADPYAESFYAKYGAERIGEAPSGSIPGRFLPRMRFTW
jgi:hypothetical protein